MHRTFGDGYVEEPAPGQYHRFIDQALPTVPGTVDTAEYNNAVQEEICNVIELNGETLNGGGLNGTPIADRVAGWRQLYDVIFQNGHLDDNAVDSFTFGVMSGGVINITSGDYEWYQSHTQLLYTDDTKQGQYNSYRVNISDTGASENETTLTIGDLLTRYDNVETSYNGKGIRYKNGPGESGFQSNYYRKASWSLTSIPWAPFLDSNGDNTSIYVSYQDYPTDIPDTMPAGGIIGAWIQYIDGSVYKTVPATVDIKSSGGYIVIDFICICVGKNSAAPNATAKIILEYDATNLDL